MQQQIQLFQEALEQALASHTFGQRPAELYEPIGYLLGLGGKRLRPLLTLQATWLFTDNWQPALRPALAVEVFHNFTLMHDDIMDRAPLRRGFPTVHARWNENVAILSGDVMLVNAYELLLQGELLPDLLRPVLQRFSRTAAEVCEGQQYDMNFENQPEVSEADYLEMIRLKTAVLLGFALELGGWLGRADAPACRQLFEIGQAAGMGFQLKDDLLDVYGDPGKFGKLVGGDILANKKTFLLTDALTHATPADRRELEHWLADPAPDPLRKVQAVTALYDRTGVRPRTEALMRQYFDTALLALQTLAVPAERRAVLAGFLQDLMQREK